MEMKAYVGQATDIALNNSQLLDTARLGFTTSANQDYR